MYNKLKSDFARIFDGNTPEQIFFAPGRVNLIGEHTDYNGGHVFPCALTLGTYAAVRKRNDHILRFYSLNFASAGMIESSVDNLIYHQSAGWTNYPKGVMWAMKKRGYEMHHGLDILIYGDIPSGSGLSSSASLEVLTGLMLREIFGFQKLSMTDLALIGQDAENNFCGCNCGIMDQFASAMGKKDHAIFLNTATLNYKYAPVVLSDASIIITNSNVKHSLVTSAYNDRRQECEQALHDLQKELDIQTLGDLDETTFEAHVSAISDPVCQKRARHAVYENQRTIRAVQALESDDIHLFGRLMNASHTSLRDDYEVSCPEIDLLVSQAQRIPGVLGSRITGGGFGGCTVSIVKNFAIEKFQEDLTASYSKEFGKEPAFYIVSIGDGAKRRNCCVFSKY